MEIIKLSISRPITVIMFYLLLVFTGIISFIQLPVEFLPDLGYPKLTVITTYENASPEEIEEMITNHIEEVVSTLKDVREVTSVSRDEVSLVTLNYNWGTDMEYASLQLREKLDNLRFRLPEESDRPNIARLDPSESPIMYISVSSNKTDNITEIQDTAENYLKKRLQQLDGVAAADVIGDLEEEIQILLDETKVNSFGLSLDEIASIINRNNIKIPGGSITEGYYRFNITISGEYVNLDEIADTPIIHAKNGTVVFLRDIADIKKDYKSENSITRLNKSRSLGLLIRKEAGANTVSVCKTVRKTLGEFEQEYPDLDFHISVDQSEFIKESIKSVLESIIIGAFLAFLVLFMFLSDVKSPLHIAIVIPIAVLATFIMMLFGKISLNIISLSGLALGVGMLVDNSIVVSENIFRHRENGKNWLAAAYDGTKEVGMAITASTLTTLAVFIPIIYVKGIAASLFRQQALTVTFSLLGSLLVSITLLPMLASFREKTKEKRAKKERKIFRPRQKILLILFWLLLVVIFPFKMIFWLLKMVAKFIGMIIGFISEIIGKLLKNIYNSFQNVFNKFRDMYLILLEKSLQKKVLVLSIFFVAFMFSLVILWVQNKEFFPNFEQSYFTLLIKMDPGTSLSSTDEIVARVEDILAADKRVKDFFTSVGRSTEDRLSYYLEESTTEHLAEIKINIISDYKTDAVMNKLRTMLKDLPGEYTFKRGDNELLSFLDIGSSGLMVRIYGSEYEKMAEIAKTIQRKISEIPDFYEVNGDFDNQIPYIHLKVNREMLSLYNVSESLLATTLKTYISGNKISNFYQFDNQIDITLKTKNTLNLQELLKANIIQNGNLYQIGQFVTAEERLMPQEIEHIDQYRVMSVSLKYRGNIQNAVSKLEMISDEFTKIDDKVFLRIEGMNEQIDESLKSLILALSFAILLVYMILASQFESFLLPLIIMFTVPMGLIGVAAALFISQTSISVMSTLGMIILSGIIVNDAILLVDRISQMRKAGNNVYDAIIDAAKSRLRPILMTTFTTVLGLLPLALAIGSGAELQSAMAVAVIGGMLTATFLTLIFIPVLVSIVLKK
ncbi:MAG: efflux RND transporter permease subunit [Candidatus Cloacimonetes bacterium]|nr:efflux RND transporter permease subunit [Candidatus Cloacimonadota bacterium]